MFSFMTCCFICIIRRVSSVVSKGLYPKKLKTCHWRKIEIAILCVFADPLVSIYYLPNEKDLGELGFLPSFVG